MLLMDICTAVKIGNGASNFEYSGVSASRKTEAVGYQLQHTVAGGVQFTVLLDEAWRHLGVAMDFGAFIALQLDFSRTCHSLGNFSGTFRVAPIHEITIFDCRHLDMDVDPIEQRPGNTRSITVNGNWSARTLMVNIS